MERKKTYSEFKNESTDDITQKSSDHRSFKLSDSLNNTKINYQVGVELDINSYIDNVNKNNTDSNVYLVLPVDQDFNIPLEETLQSFFFNTTNLHVKTLNLNKSDLKLYQRDGFVVFSPYSVSGSKLNFSIIAANFSLSDSTFAANIIMAINRLESQSFSLFFLIPGYKNKEPFFLDGTNQTLKLSNFLKNNKRIKNISFSLPNIGKDTELAKQLFYNSLKSSSMNSAIKPHLDKIDFHLDDPALEDKLGRKPIAKSLAKLINDDIFGNKKCHAFMTHLQGRWGEGKSSFMKFLENGLQEAGNDRWIVIHYNAWKNQDVDPPWWTFLDAVYRQGREQIANKSGKRFRFRVKLNEHIRRLNSGTLLTLSVFAFIIFLILSVSNLFGISFLYLPETAKIAVSVSTVLASLWAIGQSWSKFFITNTPENARLFMRRTENPSAHIKQHFEELVKDLQTKHTKGKENYHIAVFIDDLDRCDGKFVVSLLEGIQTMFNEQKVFYLVAADKHWIAKSFENVYSEYIDTVKKGTKLGYSFIEKNFQLSIRLPNPSGEQISRYWGHILKQESYNQLSGTGNTEGLKRQLQETGQEAVLSGEANLEELAEQYNTTIEDAQNIMLETVNETTEDIEHLLMEHHKLLGNNPRAVKRLANQYTVYRNLVLIEQNKVDPLKLFRWVILQNRWPVLVDKLEQDPAHINDYDELLEELDLVSYSIDIEYVMGKDDEKITLDDVVTYTGISQITSDPGS
ncbi:MAG: P-loop NTPase fold protein [Balneola sp.]